MKKYVLKYHFGGMREGDIIETAGEIGEVFPADAYEEVVDPVLEVATPERVRTDEPTHIDNEHGGVITSHYSPVVAQQEEEQPKPKRGRPAKQDAVV